MIRLLYPGGKTKALTFSYDDGKIHDRRLVKLFNTHGLKATFHLNSGLLEHPGTISRQEAASLYDGHEVACHGVLHAFPSQLSNPALVREFLDDRIALEQCTGRFITGLSYAYGDHSPEVRAAAHAAGLLYARTVRSTGKFFPPADFLQWDPTCHHARALDDAALTDAFLEAPGDTYPMLYYIWGHSYEFERDHTWEQMESLCRRLAGRDDIWYVTNIDYYHYLQAARRLVYSAQGDRVYNPTGIKVWVCEQWPGPHSVKIPAAFIRCFREAADMSFLTVPTDGIATVFHATDSRVTRSHLCGTDGSGIRWRFCDGANADA